MFRNGRPLSNSSFQFKTSSSAAQPRSIWRTRLVASVVGLVWIALSVRLVQLQWVGQADFEEQADRQRSHIELIPARPGEILDRNGKLLAATVSTRSLYVVPSRMPMAWPTVVALSGALDLDADTLFDRVSRHQDKHFLWVKRRLNDKATARVRALKLPPAVYGFRDEFVRRYPQGKLAAHVLGMRDIDGKGRGGLEEKLDYILGGKEGRRKLVRDARGRVMQILDAVAESPTRGQPVRLTLDTIIQLHAERELDQVVEAWKPRAATAIVMDPNNGEILAMASRPSFNPNEPQDVPDTAWKNQAISIIYEPGSTFKPFVVAWALQHGQIQRDEIFDCEHGLYRMGRRELHDHHPYGRLSVTDILVKSSNIGMAKIGERMTNERLHAATLAFGFGRKTGIELPGELTGIVRRFSKWDLYSTGSIPMGQELAVTPLQLIVAHAALANGGKLISPTLVKRDAPNRPVNGGIEGQGNVRRLNESAYERGPKAMLPRVVSQVVDPQIAQWLVEGPMTEVVRRGTGTNAKLDGYTVFGKTGTAQKLDRKTGKYSDQLHVSSFICGAPADKPRVLVLVVVDEPSVGKTHFGGTIAAPAAAAILRKTLMHLRVPLDKPALRAAKFSADASDVN